MVTMIQCIFRSHLCRPMLLRYGDEVLSRYSACLSTYIFWHLNNQADQKKADLHIPSSNDTSSIIILNDCRRVNSIRTDNMDGS